jgi:hypothetical protein
MLGKLIKHEFRATSRIMLPVFLAMLVLSVLANFSIRTLAKDNNPTAVNLICGLITTAFGVCIVALILIAIVLMVQRFHRNLLTDEGYLMFTLPTSVHNLVCSKMIVSVVWFLLTGVVILLAALISCMSLSFSTSLIDVIHQMMQGLQTVTGITAVHITGYIAEGLILVFVNCAILCVQFYAAMAVGYGFANRKTLMSVVFFFIFQFGSQFLLTALFALAPIQNINLGVTLSGPAQVHMAMILLIIGCLIYFAIFYAITVLALKKRLNLE